MAMDHVHRPPQTVAVPGEDGRHPDRIVGGKADEPPE
jgi:hypothetical protein